jgi:hypothetical protein
VGVWRRSAADISLDVWHRLSTAERGAAEVDVISVPLPGLNGPITVRLEPTSEVTARLESPARTRTATTALNKKVQRLVVLIGKGKRRSRLQDCQTPGYSATQLYSREMEGLRRLSGINLVMQSELD